MTNPTQNDFLSDSGIPRHGCAASHDEALKTLQEQFSGRSYCLVRDWTIFRADLTADELQTVHARGHEPLFLYASNVIEDSRARFQPGDWVRSSICVSFDGEMMFETRNTVYVLMGNGVEKTASLKTIFSFFNG